MKNFLRSRANSLRKRPYLIRKFLNELVCLLGHEATVIVFGGRGSLDTIYSSEPRDLDLMVIVKDNVSKAEELIYNVKPRTLPADIIVLKLDTFNPCKGVLRNMLKKHIIIHDGLGIKSLIDKCVHVI
ncbi:MAG: hypothetical protein DRO18_02045 [Thermoprotei archaeon]|nr:MAG: hypothetical protein B6U85_07295 [Desulfurococcales archaeon ex4484_42]RLG88104.1 MAG: hypothetical protein DRO18_02045 [Thermoprotei archaeon]